MWFAGSLAVARPNSPRCSSPPPAIPRQMKMKVRPACQSRFHEFACGISLSVFSNDESFSTAISSDHRAFVRADRAIHCRGCATTAGIPGGKTSQPAAIPVAPPARNGQTEPPVATHPDHVAPTRPTSEAPAPAAVTRDPPQRWPPNHQWQRCNTRQSWAPRSRASCSTISRRSLPQLTAGKSRSDGTAGTCRWKLKPATAH